MLCCSLPLLLAVIVLGCRDGRVKLPTAPVSGTVTYNGKPLGFGRIVFVHPSSGQVVGASIAADGAFKLTAYQGKNCVAIEYFEADRPGSTKVRSFTDKSLLPERYVNYSTSGLVLDVKPGENKNIEFTLKETTP